MLFRSVLNAAKICFEAVNKGPMAALFQTWPKKWLFYLIKGQVVISLKKKKKRQLMKIKKRNQDQNHGVEKLVGDSCVQYTLAL